MNPGSRSHPSPEHESAKPGVARPHPSTEASSSKSAARTDPSPEAGSGGSSPSDRFGVLSTEQLRQLLQDEGKLQRIVRLSEQLQALQEERKISLASNFELAQKNLSLRPRLETGKANLAIKYQLFRETCASCRGKLRKIQCLLQECNPHVALSHLQEELQSTEAECEALSQLFLEGSLPLLVFLDSYHLLRAQCHIRRIQNEKLLELLGETLEQDTSAPNQELPPDREVSPQPAKLPSDQNLAPKLQELPPQSRKQPPKQALPTPQSTKMPPNRDPQMKPRDVAPGGKQPSRPRELPIQTSKVPPERKLPSNPKEKPHNPRDQTPQACAQSIPSPAAPSQMPPTVFRLPPLPCGMTPALFIPAEVLSPFQGSNAQSPGCVPPLGRSNGQQQQPPRAPLRFIARIYFLSTRHLRVLSRAQRQQQQQHPPKR
ncbi:PREDICTED: vacuolar protein sorting-associated protein 37D [Nanorana parkeri]|uniref:vacuolar protein sorting-associated protein 37D n=1 Tax=Nanorana parkeri TaxID=125878 RepID=UPI000854B6B3|nr:PREDICTED: vacuolar protein sorting-associated protein 37D [Nanorana parkeri]